MNENLFGNEISSKRECLQHLRMQYVAEASRLAELTQLLDLAELETMLNRHAFERKIDQIIVECDYYNDEASLVYLDISNFDQIKQIHGEDVLTQLLCHVEALLRISLRDSDYIGRLGGEKFGLILSKCSISDAACAMRRVIKNLTCNPVNIDEVYIMVTANHGLASLGHVATAQEAIFIANKSQYIAGEFHAIISGSN